jgi:hypothetical protein
LSDLPGHLQKISLEPRIVPENARKTLWNASLAHPQWSRRHFARAWYGAIVKQRRTNREVAATHRPEPPRFENKPD